MGRKRKIETSVVIDQIDKYREENPGIKVKYTDLCNYMQKNGIFVEDRIIRRNPQISSYVKKINNTRIEVHINTVSVYKDLDINELLAKCNTIGKLKNAISDRECYYREVAESASMAFKEAQKALDLAAEVRKENKELVEKNKELSNKNKQIGILKRTVKELKNYIVNFVQPEIASTILNDCADIDNHKYLKDIEIIDSNTDMSSFKEKMSKKLMEGFDD